MADGPTDAEIEDTVALMRGPAYQKALQSQNAIGVAAVYRSKGIPKEVALREAEKLVEEAKAELKCRRRPHLFMGWFVVGASLVSLVLTLLFWDGFVVIPIGMLMFGLFLVWNVNRI